MSADRSAFAPPAGSSSARHRRWVAGAAAILGVSGLVFGGVAAPVSAGDRGASGHVGGSVTVSDDCPTGCVHGEGGGEAEDPWTAIPEEVGGDVEGDIGGEVTIPVDPGEPGDAVPDEVGDRIPGDPGDAVPDEVGDRIPGDLGDVVPDEVGDRIPGDLGDVVPGDGGGLVPGDLGEVPGGGTALLSDGLGIGRDLADRLSLDLPDLGAAPGEGGNGPGGAGPAGTVPAGGSGSAPAVAGSTIQNGGGRAEPGSGGGSAELLGASGGRATIPAGGTLPRTGGGAVGPLLPVVGLFAACRGLLRLAGPGHNPRNWA